MRLVFVLLAFVLLVLFAVAAVLEIANSGKVFKGVTIAGEPAGGMTRAQALKVAQAKVKPLSDDLKLYYADQEFELDPKSYSVRAEPQAMAFAAYLKGREDLLPVRLFKRLFGISNPVDIPVLFSYNEKQLQTRIGKVAESVNKDSTSARISVATGSPDIVPSQNGVKVRVGETAGSVRKALPGNDRRVPLVVEYIHPELTEKDIAKIIVIQLSEFRLFLYDREKYIDDYLVAVGMPAYPTPTGKFHVTYKEKNPTWLPTSEWAKDKQGVPQPPGKDNPLGDYWIDLGGGIGIHGTPFVKSLGERASHGCIRMTNENARVLYETVNIGAPVFIVP